MNKETVNDRITLCSVGDVNPARPEPGKMFDLCTDVLRKFDIRMCQLESNLVGGQPAEHEGEPSIPGDPKQVEALTAAGFDVATCAGNHAHFGGIDAMLEGQELLRKNGIKTVGVGKTIAEARRPIFMDCKGTKFAFLNYNSVMKNGEWATETRPGVAPLRIKTLYEMMEPTQPGTPSVVHTFADYDDLDAMLDDIREAKSQADIVILSMHWGIHFLPFKLPTFERPIARYAIDAGADIIIGTHPHILKGVEVYKGKVIFHSLGNFAFDSFKTKLAGGKMPAHMAEKREAYGIVIDPAWASTYPYAADSRKTMLVKCEISNKKIEKVSFLPAMIQIDARPRVLSYGEEGFDDVVNYMKECNEKLNLNTNFKVEDDEVVVLT